MKWLSNDRQRVTALIGSAIRPRSPHVHYADRATCAPSSLVGVRFFASCFQFRSPLRRPVIEQPPRHVAQLPSASTAIGDVIARSSTSATRGSTWAVPEHEE